MGKRSYIKNMNDVIQKVPFHSQHWDLDNWQALGFTSYDDAEYWQRSSCGVLCLQMTAEYFLHRQFSLIDLIRQGKKISAYTDQTGWSHEGLVRLATSIGLKAERRVMKASDIVSAIDQQAIPIISIKWAFDPTKTVIEKVLFWKKYGGHLAVVVGYRKVENKVVGFYIHHTSKISEQNWIGRFVPSQTFERGYTGRAISISVPHSVG